jgi:hypothetical protein
VKRSKLLSLSLISSGFVMVIAFQNCSKVGFVESASLALKAAGRYRGVDHNFLQYRERGLDRWVVGRDPG